MLPFTKKWETGATKDQLFTNFHPKVSSLSSWLLVTSDPSAGQMEKSLYHSDNDGKWSFVTDVGMTVDGYPTGIYFLDNQDGWIAAKQHGKSLVPLFRTQDGGKTWRIQTITYLTANGGEAWE
ncbi:beta propeller repeat protein [Paenibacillus alba]|uniref:Photosynthesis system II assembly factor Ycf48/Hcf136-like domain-containing protein n=1 Tax=Paenibacillus alba TaxID=1197127 RepID=A0ABU6G6G8_9BACL|nr:hypothetical protein [Paenibacillus alba]MEC0229762.1 hypothetical protein [Paenibacillus alba]